MGAREIGHRAVKKQIATMLILPTLDCAVDVAKRDDVAIVSGFHSKMNRDVLAETGQISY